MFRNLPLGEPERTKSKISMDSVVGRKRGKEN